MLYHKSRSVGRVFLVIILIGLVRFTNGQTGSLTYSTTSDFSTIGYNGDDFNISGQATDPRCVQLSPDGTRAFVVNQNPDRVFQYNLSVPHDITSAFYSGLSLDTSPPETNPEGIGFSKDGTFMYLVGGDAGSQPLTYTLSNPFDISSASYASGNNMQHLTLPTSDGRGVAISNSGRRIFIALNNEEIRQYNLGTPYDLTTATDPGRFIDVLTIDTDINTLESVVFNADGSKFFFTERTEDRIRGLGLGTDFQLSSSGAGGTNLGSREVSGQDSGPRGVTVSGDGTKLYMVGDGNNPRHIYQYEMSRVVFQETSANNGSVEGELIITLTGHQFVSASAVVANLAIQNLPTGLSINAALSQDRTTATITLSGNATQNNNSNNISNLRLSFSNGAFSTGTTSSISNSTNVNTGLEVDFIERPMFTNGNTASFPENSANDVIDIQANDGDGGGNDSNVDYSITGGADASFFTINSGNGRLRFDTPPDFENPQDNGNNNSYVVRVTATDETGLTRNQNITVTVTDVVESATFNINAIANANVNENLAYTSVTPSISGTPIGTVIYTLGGADAADFTINSTTGVVSMVARNFESPVDANGDNVYVLQITATDSDGNNDTEAWAVAVNDVTESATFNINTIANASVNENTTYTSVTPSLTGDAPIGTVTYTLGGSDATAFTINSATGVVNMVVRDFESPADANTDNVYELSITATDADNNTASQNWNLTVNDVTESATFTIHAIADSPVNENAVYTSVTPSLSGDAPIGTVTYTLGGADALDFTINSATGVVSMVARDFESPVDANGDNVYVLQITATDSDGNDDTEAWTVTVNDITETATFTIDAIANANINENSSYTSVTPGLSGDSPIGTMTYTLGGTDASDFTINSSTGVVSMVARNFESPVDANGDNVYVLQITATDSDGNDDTEAWTVTVNDITESATFNIDAIANTTVNENATYTSVTPSLSGDAPIGIVTYNLGGADASDFTINSNTGVVSMVPRDFESPVDANGDNVYVLQITATDSDGNDNTEAWTVTVNDVTELSNFTINTITNANVNENLAYTSVTPSLSGDAPIGIMTYTLGGADAIAFTINSSTGVVSMVARDFESPVDANTDNVYVLQITATDSDGNDDTEAWTVTVNDVVESAIFNINTIANASVNENAAYTSVTPSITGTPIGTVTYTLGGTDAADFTINSSTGVVSMVARDFESPVDANGDNVYALQITATDSDGNDDTETWTVTVNDVVESATFNINAIANANVNENLAYTSVTPSLSGDAPIGIVTYNLGGADAADFTINSSTGVVSMVARDFESPVDANGDNVYVLQITATDSDGNDDIETWTVTVNDITESATFTIDAIADANVNENAAYTSVTPSISGTPIGTVTYTLGGADAADFTINSSTGVVSMVARDFESPVDANGDNVYDLQIIATDSDGNNDTEAWTVTVNDITETATFTIDAIADANVNENAAYTSVTPSISGTPIGTVTYTLGGADAIAFTINGSTGVVSMVARDFESPVDANGDNVYVLQITATDSDGNDDIETWTVTVNDITESAAFTINAIANANVNENAAYTSVTPSISGTPIGTVTYTLGGADAADFTINSSTGVVSMVPRNFESPVDANGDNVYVLQIIATDSDGNDDTENWTVTVNDVVESAIFNINTIANANVNENSAYTSITPSLSGDAPIGSLTYTLGGIDAADFSINSTTGLVSMVARDFESPVDANGDNVYVLQITATDSDGNDDTEAWTITVIDITETATFTIDAIADANVNESAAYISVTPSLSGDAPIGTVTYTLGGSDATAFTINSATGVVNMVARDFESPADANKDNVYELSITATDADNNTASQNWNLTVNDVTESATFTIDAIADATVNENAVYTSVTPSLSGDAPIGTVTYTLGGTDAADFTINSSTGVVSMISRDFESPADANTDNVYQVSITATDSDGNNDTETWTVTVNDVTESAAFTINAIPNINVNENSPYTSVTPNITGTPIGTVAYILGGTDAADFTINSSTGVVSMVSRDFENPADNNADNVYEVFIIATDSDGNDDTEDWTVTVNDVTETVSFNINVIANANISENAIYTSVTPSLTGDAPIGIVTYSLGGTDAADFTINSTTGVVSMVARDFENPADENTDNMYEVSITATDSDGNDDTQTWTVTVNDVTESAAFTINAISNTNVNENSLYTSVTPNIAGTPIGTVTYTLGGTDAADFTINSSTGVVSMISRDFESPADANTDNVYEVSITATDTDNNMASQNWTVTVNDITESASFTIAAIANANVSENATYTSVTPSITGIPIGTITYTLGGTDALDFTINSITGVVSMVARDFESPVDANADNVYEVSITATDSDGNDDIETWTVTVNDVTESATFNINAIANANVNENTTYTSVTPSLSGDAPIGTVTYTLGGADAADLTINSSTGVVSMVARDFENPADANGDNVYVMQITATDSDGNTDAEVWTVSINNLNDETPVFTSSSTSETYLENASTPIFDFDANDGDGGINDGVNYSVFGADADIFNISAIGELTFANSPDFENPLDSDRDNSYQIIVSASDGILSIDLSVIINVLDDLDDNGDVEIIVINDDPNTIIITPNETKDVDVGITTLNVEVDTPFEVRNTGQIAIEILQIILSDNNFEITNIPPLIEASESSEFTVTLLATQAGVFSSTVEIITTIGSISFEVTGEVINLPKIEVKNVVSPNGDGKHDFLKIENIEFYPNNRVEIFNRVGSKVFSIENYNNSDRAFIGIANIRSSKELSTGTYYYTIQQGRNRLGVGFLLLRR